MIKYPYSKPEVTKSDIIFISSKIKSIILNG